MPSTRGRRRRFATDVAAVALVAWVSIGAIGRGDAHANSEGLNLPAYFDGCALLTADEVSQAAGAPFTLSESFGPEGPEAASCAYQSKAVAVELRVFTKASATGDGLDFGNDANFVGDFHPDISRMTEVPDVGEWARVGPPADGSDAVRILLAHAGEARIVLTMTGASDNLALGRAIAVRFFQLLATNPPSPDPVPRPNSLAPMRSTYQFGDGRSISIGNLTTRPVASLIELAGDRVTGRNLYYANIPPELDLRDVALSRVGDDRVAILEFGAPFAVRTTWGTTPVQMRVSAILRAPSGGDAVALELGPDGVAHTVTDPDGVHSPSGTAAALITGNWLAFLLPGSLGIDADWTAQFTVRIDMPATDSDVTGWELVTVPVSVGSLTGEVTGGVTLAPPIEVTPAAGAAAAPHELYHVTDTTSPAVTSVTIDASSGHRELIVTFDRAPSLDGLGDSGTEASLDVELSLAAPGALGAAPPFVVQWSLRRDATGAISQPNVAQVRSPSGSVLGTVPITLDGAQLRLELDSMAYLPTPSTTSVPATANGSGVPTLALGGDTRRFRLNVVFIPDECVCPDGAPEDWPGTDDNDSVEVEVSGTAITFTRLSTGATAIGAVDPTTGAFLATNDTEMLSGHIDGGVSGTYARLGDTPTALRRSDLAARAGAGDWASLVRDLLDLLKLLGQSPLPPPATAPVQPPGSVATQAPCGPVRKWKIYTDGHWTTISQPPPFFLPDQSLGFDQNAYDNNYDFGRAISGRWPPAGCLGGSSLRRGSLLSTTTPGLDTSTLTDQAAVARPADGDELTGLDGSWYLAADAQLRFTRHGAAVTTEQISPQVRADRISDFATTTSPQPSTSVPSTTAADGSGATASSAPSTRTTSSGSSDSSTDTAAIAVVIVVAVVVTACVATVMTRRRRPPL